MYPYRSNKGFYQKTPINSRENAAASSAKQDLSQDKRLLELLNIAKEEINQSIQSYNALMANGAMENDMELLRNAYLDEIKHLQQLQEILYILSGETAQAAQGENQSASTVVQSPPSSAIEKTLLQEMEQTDFFRELFLCMPQTELRDILFEIITDKQDHCIRLCFLFTKYQ